MGWPSDSNPQSMEAVRSNLIYRRLQAFMSCQSATELQFYRSKRKLHIVMHHKNLFWRNIEIPAGFPDTPAAFVHKEHGFQQDYWET